MKKMKLKFKIEGLDCANCANELEEIIGKLEEVISVSISFMTERMIIETNTDDKDNLIQKVESLIKKSEPDVTITLK